MAARRGSVPAAATPAARPRPTWPARSAPPRRTPSGPSARPAGSGRCGSPPSAGPPRRPRPTPARSAPTWPPTTRCRRRRSGATGWSRASSSPTTRRCSTSGRPSSASGGCAAPAAARARRTRSWWRPRAGRGCGTGWTGSRPRASSRPPWSTATSRPSARATTSSCSATTAAERVRFTFPRQRRDRRLCLADFFRRAGLRRDRRGRVPGRDDGPADQRVRRGAVRGQRLPRLPGGARAVGAADRGAGRALARAGPGGARVRRRGPRRRRGLLQARLPRRALLVRLPGLPRPGGPAAGARAAGLRPDRGASCPRSSSCTRSSRRRRSSSTTPRRSTSRREPAPSAAVLFDMDGTLVDSEPVWDEALRELARWLGGALSAAARRATLGTNVPVSVDIVHRDVGRPDADPVAQRREADRRGRRPVRPRAGVAAGRARAGRRGAGGRDPDRAGHQHRAAAGAARARAAGGRAVRRLGLRRRGRAQQAGARTRTSRRPRCSASRRRAASRSRTRRPGPRRPSAAGCPVLVVPGADVPVPPGPGRTFADSLVGITVPDLTALVARAA